MLQIMYLGGGRGGGGGDVLSTLTTLHYTLLCLYCVSVCVRMCAFACVCVCVLACFCVDLID